MDDALLVGVLDGAGHLFEQMGGLAGRRAGGVAEAAAGDELHGEERPAVDLANLVDLDDAGVLQPGCGLGLAAEALPFGGAGKDVAADHLEGDDTVEGQLAGPVDDAHAAGAQFVEQFVAGDGGRPLRRSGLPGEGVVEAADLGAEAVHGIAAGGAVLQVGLDEPGLDLAELAIAELSQRLAFRATVHDCHLGRLGVTFAPLEAHDQGGRRILPRMGVPRGTSNGNSREAAGAAGWLPVPGTTGQQAMRMLHQRFSRTGPAPGRPANPGSGER